jgi:integrase
LAKAVYQKRKTEVREGKFFPEAIKPQGSVMFAEVAKDFLAYSRKFKRSYGHDEARMATLLRLWRDCALAELTPGRIERDLSDTVHQEEWTPATYNRYRTLASGAFSLAVKNGKVAFNPVKATRHRTENNVRVRFLSYDEEERLLKHVRSKYPDKEPEILVALYSGMRRSEQYATSDCPDGGLKWEHVDFFNSTISLPRSKHGERRHIPMNSLLRESLAWLKEESASEYVFPVVSPEGWLRRACKAAEIPNFSWHCLRHTFASRLVMSGVDIRTVQELLGHKSIVTTMRYAHLAPGHGATAVEALLGPTDTATSTSENEGTDQDTQPVGGAWWRQVESNHRTGIMRPLLYP